MILVTGFGQDMDRLRSRAEIARWAENARRAVSQRARRISPFLADVSTILAYRLREREGEGIVIAPSDGRDDVIGIAEADIESLLPEPG